MLTTQQQHDLDTWKQDQSQPLPDSLKNVLVEDCLEGLANNEKSLNKFNLQGFFKAIDSSNIITGSSSISFLTREPVYRFDEFQNLWKPDKIYIIQTLLSRTPDGQAVMPFLNVKIENSNLTLDNLLYNSFVEFLRVGGSFEESYQIINKTYLLYFDLTK